MDSSIKCWKHSIDALFPKYLKYHLIYLIIIFTSYIILKNKCFMTLLSNYYSKKLYTFLCIKMNDAKILLILSLFANVIFTIEPSISPYNFFKKIIS